MSGLFCFRLFGLQKHRENLSEAYFESMKHLMSEVDRDSKWFKPLHVKTSKMTFAPSKDSNQPGNLPSLIRVFLSAYRQFESVATHKAHSEDWSDWEDAHPDLSLRWAHMLFCWLIVMWWLIFCFIVSDHHYTFWIGLLQLNTTSHQDFIWVSGKPLDYSNWLTKPTYANHCFYMNQRHSFTWAALPCNHRLPFVCRR